MKNCNHVIGNLGRCIKCEEYERGYKDAICGTGNIKKEIEKAISQARSTAIDECIAAVKGMEVEARKMIGNPVDGYSAYLKRPKILTSLHDLKEKK